MNKNFAVAGTGYEKPPPGRRDASALVAASDVVRRVWSRHRVIHSAAAASTAGDGGRRWRRLWPIFPGSITAAADVSSNRCRPEGRPPRVFTSFSVRAQVSVRSSRGHVLLQPAHRWRRHNSGTPRASTSAVALSSAVAPGRPTRVYYHRIRFVCFFYTGRIAKKNLRRFSREYKKPTHTHV